MTEKIKTGVMTEKIKTGVSRRGVFSLVGLAIASGLAIPATVLTAADAEARIGRPLTPVSVAGVNRRHRRRDRRYKKKN